jgi:Cft2 family RNA processing exonuclease
MLQPGTSRELLELWAPDPRNGLVVTGYSVEGTLARVSLSSFCDPWWYRASGTLCYLWVCMYEPNARYSPTACDH